jgi:hypothetical protein
MLFFLTRAIMGSIVGNATATWFKKTKVGVWFYNKVEQCYNWAAKRYDIEILTKEQKLIKKFPVLSKKIDDMEKRIKKLEEK